MITLIGHGYIGTHIAKKIRNFEWISHTEIPSKNTELIINATGYIGSPNVAACETNKELCLDANTFFPLEVEKNSSVPVLHISSGCLYDGYPVGGWKETDEPTLNFDTGSFYSGCKSLTQRLLTPYLQQRSYLFRIRMPFCSTINNRNLLYKYEKYERLINYENSITCIDDLLRCVEFFIDERPEPGIYNIVNKNTTTTKQVVDMMGLSKIKRWLEISEFEETSKVKRSNCSLSTNKISSLIYMPDITTSLERTIFNYRKNNI